MRDGLRHVALAAIVLSGLAGLAACSDAATDTAGGSSTTPTTTATATNAAKLPLGDGRKSTAPRRGYAYSCQRFDQGGGGAGVDGPWIDTSAKTWDSTRKVSVSGSVRFTSRFSLRVVSGRNRLSGNGLPNHATGAFPVQSSDPAYQYDRNPNSIRSYTLVASLPRNPRRTSRTTCIGGTVGVMRNGIPLFSAFDAQGRDAAAHEVQDRCSGHPQVQGQYHYHSLPRCISDTGSRTSHSRLLGWAIDGFGIYGLRGEGGRKTTTASLDACHGHTHTITWNGRRVRMFHYHVTEDFPYTVACYRGTPITSATGLGVGAPQRGGPPEGRPPEGGPPPTG